jgi:uncharacterized protein (UPF0335 family)
MYGMRSNRKLQLFELMRGGRLACSSQAEGLMAEITGDNVAADELRQFIERIERMEEEKAAISADIKEIFAEAKGRGYDTKVLRQIVRIRKQDANERAEQEAILDLYMQAIGMS